ncbi:MAG: alpha/beta fold hydrolase [Candidatus Binatia bacterium]
MVRNISPPPARLLLGEFRGAFEPARLMLRVPLLATLPRGNGANVQLLPGYGANETSTAVLQGFLRLLGYRCWNWGLGRNHGNVAKLMPRVLARIQEIAPRVGSEIAPRIDSEVSPQAGMAIAPEAGMQVHLVGWSLGGYIAREAARERPDLIRSVITLGSPVVGGPKYTTVAARYRREGIDVDELERLVDARYDKPLATPVTAVFSKTDGIVAWEACIDRRSAGIEHVEVRTTHIGLGFCPEVYSIIANRLARHSSPRH